MIKYCNIVYYWWSFNGKEIMIVVFGFLFLYA